MEKIFKITLAQDKIKAYLTLFSKIEDKEKILREILEEIKNNHISNGIKIERIRDMVVKNITKIPLPIAEGKTPQNGEDAKLKYVVDINKKSSPEVLASGKVNHYELGTILNVLPGDILVEKIPATSGIDGIDVCGEKIIAENGKDLDLPTGEGTEINKEGTKLIANTSGQVVDVDGKICVLTTLNITGNVNLRTGNLSHNGEIIIKGSVQSKFKVEATSDIIISGNVEAGTEIVSKEGSVYIEGRIFGGKTAKISAKKDIVVVFAEFANLNAGRSIYIRETLVHSNVVAGEEVIVKGGKGAIIGGKIQSGVEVEANTIGGRSFLFTEIILMSKQQKLLIEELKMLNNEIETKSRQINKLSNESKDVNMSRNLQQQLNDLKRKYNNSREKFDETLSNKIVISGVIYPGVIVNILDTSLEVTHEHQGVVFLKQKDAIKILPYQKI